MIKAAVIGVGSMGRNHARVYNELEDVALVAVTDCNQETLHKVARIYRTKGYKDYREMLARERPDVVSVVVPTKHHHEVALNALTDGAHVLVEKPIASTLEEGWEIIEKARALNRHLMVGHIERFNPALVELKRQLDDDKLGRIFQIHSRRLGPFPPRMSNVGVVIDLATHDLDIMRYLTGSEVARLYAETEHNVQTMCDDLLSGLVKFQNGVLGVLDISWLTPTKIRELYVTGERGMFLVNYLTQELCLYENGFFHGNGWDSPGFLWGVDEGRMIRHRIQKREPLRMELEAFVRAVCEDRPTPVRGEDGLIALDLACQLSLSGQEKRIIQLARTDRMRVGADGQAKSKKESASQSSLIGWWLGDQAVPA
ncbi:MAG: Gfo/Idh/MocA family oxidoreductase [Chloroflexota bacterium]|nr:Gfo/Idh/MocA family oxidoreductase [Chloroflexota bacterium]